MSKGKFVMKTVLTVLCVVATVGFGAIAVAGSEECKDECSQQFAEDRGACAAAYNEAVAVANADYQACLASAKTLFDRLRCSSQRSAAIRSAQFERLVCENASDTAFVRCLLACEQSPATP